MKFFERLFSVKHHINKDNINAIKEYYNNDRYKINDIIYTESDPWEEIFYTPLVYAIKKRRYNIAKCLINDFNAYVAKNNKKDSSFSIFRYNNAVTEVIRICRNLNSEYSEIFDEDIKFFKYIVNKINIYKSLNKVEINQVMDYYNILHTAVYFNSYPIVKFLVEDVHYNIKELTPINKTSAIELAVANKNLDMVEYLNNNGGSINNKKLLRIAYDNKDFAMVEYLKAIGCKIV